MPLDTSPLVLQNMSSIREAFRLHRLARVQRALWSFYKEHNLLEEAKATWRAMLDALTNASRQWRLTLGTSQGPGTPLRATVPNAR